MSAARLIQLVTASKHHNLELIEEGVAQMLLQDDIKYRSVAIISVANDLLHKQTIVRDHFLRYLYAQVSTLFLGTIFLSHLSDNCI